MTSKIRLFVDQPLSLGQTVPLTSDQANYLFNVMRLQVGAVLSLINGRDGEWDGTVVHAAKRAGALQVGAQTRPLQPPPDLWLAFAPIKKARTDFIVEKATELGAARIIPVLTDHTNSERVRRDRLQAHALEAVEQCGGTFLPEVADPTALGAFLDSFPAERHLWFCDEALVGQSAGFPPDAPAGPSCILIGPEGGFSARERDRLRALPFARSIALGPRILRADTAAVAALTLWQARMGDWGHHG
ncbi:16S rRNA (uracil1498-N3)-methyltransferase [Ketogulonicigenium robustum]|uniref:Ribosomal RNA small subunit methyltransferase E n=1 Tax=Ketogulonicigenium robustum TaxID=92947 RepID=A0A1W6NXK6_9RHOB|nr:16S rRNA (uracil(1498)-N(3))-methyltransferase [Ketogulonicigenium robustum]ARO13747.1 16S rRNA (uracil1498-N3)-methyltransferase [Ketogulonicigenium robustum]